MSAPISAETVAFQGAPGAYSDMACRSVFPDAQTEPCESFEAAFDAVANGTVDAAMIPIENSIAGRVADIHHLLPHSTNAIVGEHFQPVAHCLLAPAGATMDGIREVHSHVHALGQCRQFIRRHNITPVVHADTAGAAHDVAQRGDAHVAAIASKLAAEHYGLSVLSEDIADEERNVTRFIILAADRADPAPETQDVMTSLIFQMRSVPAALYKALGGFATNGINLTKLESYIADDTFAVAQFYADVEGHPDHEAMRFALEELSFFTEWYHIVGVYPAAQYRKHT